MVLCIIAHPPSDDMKSVHSAKTNQKGNIMTGFRSIVHHGFVTAKLTPQGREMKIPYPVGSSARQDFYRGVNAFAHGNRIDKSGEIVSRN